MSDDPVLAATDATPISRAREADAWCDRFEARWQAGQRTRAEDYLGEVPESLREELTPELIALEVALRRAGGERPTPDEYRDRFPHREVTIDAAFGGLTSTADFRRLVPSVQQPTGSLETGPYSTYAPGDATPVADTVDARARGADRATPMNVGEPRFRILRPHARGGIGEVFLARDEQLQRDVAVKEIQRGQADRPESRARFRREAEITGRLEHPGVVPVYALGSKPDGRLYYAMRFIHGESLKEAADRLHSPDRSEEERRSGLRRLLRRFTDACNAVAYAHSRGVIHRDLKPANIMLGPFGETLVVDWGLAKVVGSPEPADEAAGAVPPLSRSSETLPGYALGTPRYMSPEQAAGDTMGAGTASDVYSLGATLYYLVTGSPPAVGDDVATILGFIRSGAVVPPRSVNPAVPPPLDSICRKAMALNAADRYASPRDLADDLEHWLADEPVSVHRDGPAVRLGRWARRHRSAVTGLAALVSTAVVALAVSNALIRRESALKDEQRALAVRSYALAREATDRMLSEVGAVELADVPQMEAVRHRLLEEAVRFYGRFLRQPGADSALQLELGRTEASLAQVQALLGDPVAAERSYRAAVARLARIADAPVPGPDLRIDRARAGDGLGMLLKQANRFREAEAELRAALRLCEGPDDSPLQEAADEIRYHLGAVLARRRGRDEEAERVYRDAERSYREAVDRAGRQANGTVGRPEHRARLARTLNNLGILLADAGRDDEAVAAFREGADLLARLAAAEPGVPGHRWRWARTLNNLGARHLAAGRLDEAGDHLERARDLLRGLAADFPGVTDYRHELAAVFDALGLLRAAAARSSGAEEAYGTALDLRAALAAESPGIPDVRRQLAGTRLNRASLRQRDDPRGAEKDGRAAVEDLEAIVARYPDVLEYQDALGQALYILGRIQLASGGLTEARRSLERAVALHRSVLPPAGYREGLAVLHEDLGVLARAAVGLGDHAAAAAAAEELPVLQPDALRSHLIAAAFLVECSALTDGTATTDGREAGDTREWYAQRAVRLLLRAARRGLLTDPAFLDRPEFRPLRERADFEALRSSLGVWPLPAQG